MQQNSNGSGALKVRVTKYKGAKTRRIEGQCYAWSLQGGTNVAAEARFRPLTSNLYHTGGARPTSSEERKGRPLQT